MMHTNALYDFLNEKYPADANGALYIGLTPEDKPLVLEKHVYHIEGHHLLFFSDDTDVSYQYIAQLVDDSRCSFLLRVAFSALDQIIGLPELLLCTPVEDGGSIFFNFSLNSREQALCKELANNHGVVTLQRLRQEPYMAITALNNTLNSQWVVRNTTTNQELRYYGLCLEQSSFFVQKNKKQLHLMTQLVHELRESVVDMNRRLDRLEALMKGSMLTNKVEPNVRLSQSKTGHVLPAIEDIRFTVS